MHGARLVSAITSIGVQHAPPSGGRIQHGVVADPTSKLYGTPSTYTNVGDGSASDLSATTQAHLGNSGAYFNDDPTGDAPLTFVSTLATAAIGDAYAPWGGERCLFLPTERGFALLFEHGVEDVPSGMQMGERFMLHRANPNGNYDTAVYDAGIRYLNDGHTADDGLGTTEVGYEGNVTRIKTKSGELLVTLDDTAETVTIQCYGNTIVLTSDPSITLTTAAGMVSALDDASSTIKHTIPASLTPGGFGAVQTTLDGVNNKVTHTVQHALGTMQSTIDGINGELDCIVPTGLKVGIGKAASTLTSVNQALAEAHLTTFEGSMFTQRLTDLETLVTALTTTGATGGVSYATIVAAITTLAHIPVPAGSATVFHAP